MIPVIEAQSLRKAWWSGRRRSPWVIDGLDLTVYPGEAVMLLGANGAGKSTLLWMIAGIRRPTEGKLALKGRSPRDPRARIGMGLLPERPALPVGTVTEALQLHRRLLRLRPESVQEVVERLGLAEFAHASTATLSSGMRQRVALAIALLGRPDLLLLDEPLANLDPDGVQAVRAALAEERARGTTLLIATHRQDALADLTDRAVQLSEGAAHPGPAQAPPTSPRTPPPPASALPFPPLRVLAGQLAKEALRARLPQVIALYFLALIVLTPWFGELTLGAPTRATQDLGMTLTWLLGSAIAGWQGVRAVGGVLHDRTAAGPLSRPLSRGQWLLGRFLGLYGVLLGTISLTTLGLAAVWAWQGLEVPASLGIFGGLLWMECALIASMAALLGVLVRPALAISFTAGLWAAGHLAEAYAEVAPFAASLLFSIVPDLSLFNVQEAIIYGDPLDLRRVGGAVGYGLLWSAALALFTSAVLSRRDLL